MANELTKKEATALSKHEATVEKHKASFLECGKALLAIKEGKLYRAEHDTFEEYCRKRWDFSRQHAYRLIDASETVGKMSPRGDKPATETQARELKGTESPDEVWEETQERTGKSQPSATEVRETKEQAELRQARVKIAKADPRFDEQIHEGAFSLTDEETLLLASFKPADIKEKVVKIRLGQKWQPAPEAEPAPGNVHPKNQKPKKNPGPKPLVKELKKAIGPVSRALEKAGSEHGRDEHYKAVFEAIKDIKETLESWLAA